LLNLGEEVGQQKCPKIEDEKPQELPKLPVLP
jgi:hypothetical protein